jgi:magnesium-transporting ATPase (P-type)
VAPSEHAVLEELARAAVLCNDAFLRERDGVWAVEGDPMEGALLAFAGKLDVDARRVIGYEALLDDPRFQGDEARLANRDALDEVLRELGFGDDEIAVLTV